MKYEKSAGAILFFQHADTREYLLLHYPLKKRPGDGHWDYPKGHVEDGEGEQETVEREVEEETGIRGATYVKGFRESITYFFTKEGKKIRKEVVFFLGQSPSRDVNISHEHAGYEWLPYEKALDRLTFENAKELLRKAHRKLKAERII